ncbi:hypothetical protein TTHERM_00657600 (macronuclear) [Tetrahymena thermophila SB210]|uniref:Uncharacterized protein n=1 Tax=Tetrahymena thermophila (strain SB210) TaxID=312017 RepID=I7MM21_TETTS|nr:hypothetical protein TTHERM_00657600 [Tetrahymena thermophila SB210]EAS03815.1 hypothetical protein TTHERM_00657600 [Tetrahymena thermophila SB210]|eukprot:XP_001024060.1 hypothetical protein TTHERM_00657600 [Tetrahymena thermophila SB210]
MEVENLNNNQDTLNIQENQSNNEKKSKNNQLSLKEKQLQIASLTIQPSFQNTFYLHGDIVLCLRQLSCLNICRKFHHNNIYRHINNIRIWKPQSFSIQEESLKQTFIEASFEKPKSSLQDYKGLAESLILHGSNQSEYLFGQNLIDWYNQGQKLIQFVKQYYSFLTQKKLLEQYLEQEGMYKNELLQLIYQTIEQQICKVEFFQYNIIEFNQETCQYETTRIGISKGLSCLLGADEQGSQQIIIRNGAFEYLDNATNLNIQRQKMMWFSNQKQVSQQVTSNNNELECYIENQAVLHTLDEYQLTCRVLFQRLPIKHDLLNKYPYIFKMQQSLFNNLGYLPYPDLVSLEIKIIEVEPSAISSLLQQRSQQMNPEGDSDIEYLKDQLEYSVRSMDFIEKFYDSKLLAKKKRFRRKKGQINDWEYLKYKYEEYKQQQQQQKYNKAFISNKIDDNQQL